MIIGKTMKNIMSKKIIIVFFLVLISNAIFSKENSKTLKFEKGKISTIAQSVVIRGERDVYLFSAKPGQRISIAITSLEDNAVFEFLYQKNGVWEVYKGTQEARVWYGGLPKSESNSFKIKVGGTRGNASYELFVGISVVDY
jgi:hypothetical protein